MVGPVERWRGRCRGLDEGMELDGRGAETVRGRGSQEWLPSGRECAIPDGIHLSPYRGAADWPWTFKVTYLQSSPRFVSKAIELMRSPIERVEINSPDGILPGYLIPSGTKEPAPVVIFYNGFDVTKELLYAFIRNEFANRDIACLVIDTPGTGEPLRLRNVPSRPDYEVPTAAIVDYLETRAHIDSDRIGIVGISLGGYCAPRSAAFEPRIKACVAWGAIWDYGATWQRRWKTLTKKTSVPFWQLPWVMDTDTMEEALDRVRPFSLAGVLSNLKQPFLVVHGDKDAMIPIEDAQKVVDKAGSLDKQLKIFTAAEGGCDHVGADNPDPIRQLIVHWFAQRLGTVARP
ncbi:dipeptidyl aminopeptidase/acylaminoacyl-peptidase [Umbelopsis sp. PMI_123]|nr:dipeptidyl aminopeptidase/acylaminoacyl-peptidase [Umbelopsis sp. PMI_123]